MLGISLRESLSKPHQLPIVPCKKQKKLPLNEIRPEQHHQGQDELYVWMGSAVASKNSHLPPIANNSGNRVVFEYQAV